MNFSSLLRYEGMTLEIVIWSLFIGIVIGVFGSFYVKQILGAFVRKLLSENANSPQNAKSLEETGFGGNPFVINALDGTGSLRRLIRCADETDDADDDTGNQAICQPKRGGQVGHDQTHTGTHDDGTEAAINPGEGIGRTLDLRIQRFQLVQLGMLLFGVLGADLLNQKFLFGVGHGTLPLSFQFMAIS